MTITQFSNGLGNLDSRALILAIETSGRIGSVALATSEELLDETTFSAPMKHSAELFPSIERLLQKTSWTRQAISHCFISIGPGSFTGLRIAVSAAKAMSLANDTRVVAVNTLDVIAANACRSVRTDYVAPILDAKRGQFFTAGYQRTDASAHLHKVFADCLQTPEEILSRCASLGGSISLLGEGLLHHRARFSGDRISILDPSFWMASAATVYALGKEKAARGEFSDPLTLTPYYLRAPQVTTKRTLD